MDYSDTDEGRAIPFIYSRIFFVVSHIKMDDKEVNYTTEKNVSPYLTEFKVILYLNCTLFFLISLDVLS